MFKGILIEKGCADYRSALDEPNSDIFFLTAMRGIKQTPKIPAAGAEADSKGFIPGAKPAARLYSRCCTHGVPGHRGRRFVNGGK